MSPKKIKIIADSSADILALANTDYASAPLKIITAQKEYIDDSSLDVLEMVNDLMCYKGKSSTSCPNSADWLEAFGDAEEIFCVTITATLSGSFNAAMLAKQTYEEQYPKRRVFVLNSLSTGPEMALIIEKLEELIVNGEAFDDICNKITSYSQKTGLLFMLESMKNLANNGRVSPLVAKMTGILGIRIVGKASNKGDLEPLNKCRGEAKALEKIVENLKELGVTGGKINIAHCFNETAAKSLETLLKKEFSDIRVKIYNCRGLCSFYAEKGGLLIGFEKA